MAGRHMAQYLRANVPGAELFAVVTPDVFVNPGEAGAVKLCSCDLSSGEQVGELVKSVAPDYCLAFLNSGSTVALPGEDCLELGSESPERTAQFAGQRAAIASDIFAAVNLLEALRCHCHDCRVLLASSGAVYAGSPTPISEDGAVEVNNIFALTKLTVDVMGFQYYSAYRIPLVRVRPFELIGPDLECGHWLSRLCRDIVAWEVALASASCLDEVEDTVLVHVPDPQMVRDFLDVRDYVEACWLAVNSGVAGEVYNICSGEACTMERLLDSLQSNVWGKLSMATGGSGGISCDVSGAVSGPRKAGLVGQMRLVGCGDKFSAISGWRPRISLRESLADLLQAQRAQVGQESGR